MKKEVKDAVNTVERAPVVVIMGHIDHGKSTLLAYIRKSNKPLNEAGDITQHISAYEVEHETNGKKHNITFLDTPGHEAFSGIRRRGASVADIAVLVVSSEDGVKQQTIEALNSIIESKTPYIVAINKIDKPGANVDRTKQTLLENQIYIEGYGGDVPAVAISSKTGQGIPELLDMITLVAELQELKGDRSKNATGVVIESNLDVKKGITATCVIKDGSMKKGMFIVSGTSSAPLRIIENYEGKPINDATFSSPVRIIGWDELPEVGATFNTYSNREEVKEAVAVAKEFEEKNKKIEELNINADTKIIPLILKADTGSSLEAITSEIKKLNNERIQTKVVSSSVGTISEGDVRIANGKEKAYIIGFNTNIDSPAKNLAERNEIVIQNFNIIYQMSDWLKETLITNTPKLEVLESSGKAKILKTFSKTNKKQILGARVETGSIKLDALVKISRRGAEIGDGKIKELQEQRVATKEVVTGKEFGVGIESSIEIAPGDYIESFIKVIK